jgi:hypothetical protein
MEQNTPVPMSGYKPFQKREGDEGGKKSLSKYLSFTKGKL